MTVKTYGLSHVALSVRAPGRSFSFYERLLGAKLLAPLEGRESDDLSGEEWIEFGIPGSHDVITLRRSTDDVSGHTGDLAHFGFRLVAAEHPDTLARAVEEAGGTVRGAGRFESSGDPYVFAKDPDGYEIELWYEADAGWRAGVS